MKISARAGVAGLIAGMVLSIAPEAPGETATGGRSIDHIALHVAPKILNPARGKTAAGKMTLTAFYSDGSQRVLKPSEAVITPRTKVASGNVEVAAVEGDKVVPKEGGIATIEAAVAEGGKTFKAAAEVVVAPYYRDYHQALVMKLFLGMEGDPVARLANDFREGHDVMCTFEDALELIRKTDNLTRGMPKIIYLVGWQKGGHDHGYPAWSEVNPRMKRAQDATALDSLRWLIREARSFNTTVSLHINMLDAYKQSPLFDEYVARDCFARDAGGQLLVAGIQMKGEDMYNVVYPKEWEAGLAQRRIDGLIKMIPELKEGHTIHIDVFIANRDGGKPISPWHAKPENGGLTPDKYVETQRKIFRYWRDRGFDVTGEGTGWAHPPGEHFIGLQAMSWWYSWDPMAIPECLGARGRTDRGGDGDHVTLGRKPRRLQDGRAGDEGHDADRPVMRRNRRGVGGRQPCHHFQQGEGCKGNDEGQDHPGHKGRPQADIKPMVSHRHPALEADGEQKVDRHPLRHGFRNGQLAARKGGKQAKGKAQDHWRQQVGPRQRQDILQGQPP